MPDLISVIIPVKNGSKYIKQAIESIKSQKMYTEIIVIDDGSEDNTVKIAKSLSCQVIKHEINKGPVAAKNSGLKIAKGKYILFLDHDDIIKQGTLSRLYNEITAEEDIYMVMAKVEDFLSSDIKDKNVFCKKEPYWGLFTGAVLMKKELFDKVGLFDESVYGGEIIELQGKMAKHSLAMKKIDFVAAKRRIHDTNFGRTSSKKEYENYAAILRKRLLQKKPD